MPSTVAANTAAVRTVQFISADSERALAIGAELQTTLAALSPSLTWWQPGGGGAASHVLGVFSSLTFAEGSESAAALAGAVEEHKSSNIVYLYLEPPGEESWDFGAFYGQKEGYKTSPAVRSSVSEHECLKYRMRDEQPLLKYEHDAMALEILRRMRVKAAPAEVAEAKSSAAAGDEQSKLNKTGGSDEDWAAKLAA